MDPREQVLARGRHAGEHRLHQVHQCRAGAILRLRSLRSRCSLRHWRLLGPRRWGPFVLVDAILTPTREPSLLSSQVQHGPGHPPLTTRGLADAAAATPFVYPDFTQESVAAV